MTLSSPTVLVVDDSTTNNLLCQEILKPKGYKVFSVQSVSDAILLLKDEKPDAIILDIMMPGEDGLNLLATLKSNPQTQKIPVIILSAKDDFETKNEARNLGAFAYLCKPISGFELLNVLKKSLE